MVVKQDGQEHKNESFVSWSDVYKGDLRKITLEGEIGIKSWRVFV